MEPPKVKILVMNGLPSTGMAVHFSPSALSRMRSSAATQTAFLGSIKIPERSEVVLAVWACQVAPPSPLCRRMPRNPPAHPFFRSRKPTAPNDQAAASVLISSHFCPPLEVRRMVPDQPTAQP